VVGDLVGDDDGDMVGVDVDGELVGDFVGEAEGDVVGDDVVGLLVGEDVGESVSSHKSPKCPTVHRHAKSAKPEPLSSSPEDVSFGKFTQFAPF
jgi:hypothetical protein